MLVNITEAAERKHVTRWTVRNWVKTGKLRAYGSSDKREVLVDTEELNKLKVGGTPSEAAKIRWSRHLRCPSCGHQGPRRDFSQQAQA